MWTLPRYPILLRPPRLVAAGCTNAEVAERLNVSPRTVAQHLFSSYNKLGVSSRTAAVRRANELRLV